jgi:hypothetical protein
MEKNKKLVLGKLMKVDGNGLQIYSITNIIIMSIGLFYEANRSHTIETKF